ncbi:MAG TPA: hypothetical protein VLB50_07725, partial [Ignavibacteriaceae bacterium]|nr:hypothetical protein [Ignavibacteriaceae bacterium]
IFGLYLNSSELNAQDNGTKISRGFIDLNNDGINDNALDSDKDGIPDCKDPDFTKAQNRILHQNSYWYRYNYKYNFAHEKGNGYGPGNGMGNKGIGPRDGSGYGPGSGTGVCDGTGLKGRRGGR